MILETSNDRFQADAIRAAFPIIVRQRAGLRISLRPRRPCRSRPAERPCPQQLFLSPRDSRARVGDPCGAAQPAALRWCALGHESTAADRDPMIGKGVDGRFIGPCDTARDISPGKAVAAKATTKESLLRLATRLSRLGAWVVDVPEMTVAWSSETLTIYEVEDDYPLTFERMTALVHPDWRETVVQAMQWCMQDGLPFDLEVRAYTARRRPIWLRLIGEAERNAEGRVKCIQGAVQDISERKVAAERVRELSEQLTTTLESVSDAFIMLDRQWRFSYVNREAERLFNVS